MSCIFGSSKSHTFVDFLASLALTEPARRGIRCSLEEGISVLLNALYYSCLLRNISI